MASESKGTYDYMAGDLWCSGWITLYGKARPQGSKKVIVPKKTGKPILVDDCSESRPWRNDLSALMLQRRPPAPLRASMRVEFIVYVNRPQAQLDWAGVPKEGAPQYPATGIDLDKVARAVGDAGTGIWWRDDDQICEWGAHRAFTEGEPCVDVRAFALEMEPEQARQARADAEAAARARRTITAPLPQWESFLALYKSEKRLSGFRSAVRKALAGATERQVAVTATPGQWTALEAAGFVRAEEYLPELERREAAGEESNP